jgi:hypothetical protein
MNRRFLAMVLCAGDGRHSPLGGVTDADARPRRLLGGKRCGGHETGWKPDVP